MEDRRVDRDTLAAVTVSLALSLGLTGLAVVGWPRLRKHMLDFGSTPAEPERTLPGDELLPEADLVATRAISIAAPPEAVWPWLVQIGTGRAGAYAYDWLDRIIGLDMHSSWEIVPELQGLRARAQGGDGGDGGD